MDSEKEIRELKKAFKKLDKRLTKIEDLLLPWLSRPKIEPPEIENPDKLLDKALVIVQGYDRASASLLQRKLVIGYARASAIIDQLEERGFVGPATGSMPREVLHKEK